MSNHENEIIEENMWERLQEELETMQKNHTKLMKLLGETIKEASKTVENYTKIVKIDKELSDINGDIEYYAHKKGR